MNIDEIEHAMSGISEKDINPLTDGFAMAFLHESLHTHLGAKALNRKKPLYHSTDGSSDTAPGETVSIINSMFRTPNGFPTRENYFKAPETASDLYMVFKVNWMVSGAGKVAVDAYPSEFRTFAARNRKLVRKSDYYKNLLRNK